MTAVAEKLKTELSQLPESDRAELAHFLLRSLDEQDDADAEAAWEAELGRRAKEIRSGSATGQPAEKVMAELREKFS